MSRNFYILAATIFFFSLLSFVLMWTNGSSTTGSPGDAALWKSIALVLMMFSLLAAFIGTIAGLFEQTKRRHQESEEKRRSSQARDSRFGSLPPRQR
jgi:uncharacterized membrane protein